MKKYSVCDICNGRFSKFEETALTNSVFVMERAKLAVPTKKGKNVKGKVGALKISGDAAFRPRFVKVSGLSPENFTNFDPSTGIGHLTVSAFDKSEVATSKLLLKIGLESLYKSQRKTFNKYNFKQLKDFLTTKTNTDWPFLTTDFELEKFFSVPRFNDKFQLKKIPCELKFLEVDDQTLLFKFKYGSISMIINLLDRNFNWIRETMNGDSKAILYPEHFRRKI
jgi:hypothetical protein